MSELEYTENGWRITTDTKRHHRDNQWDYRGEGVYLITIATAERYPLFGELEDSETPETARIALNPLGKQIDRLIRNLPTFYADKGIALKILAVQVMPDHLHFIVNIGGRGATALPRVIANFKHLLSVRYGLRFQRDFFDTRLRDDAHFAEEYDYILGNPVRKGLCAAPADWPYSIAFTRDGTEIPVGSRVPRDRNGRAVAPRPPYVRVMEEERLKGERI